MKCTKKCTVLLCKNTSIYGSYGSMVLAEHAMLASSCELVLSSYCLFSPKSTDYWSISFMVILLQTKNCLYRPFLIQTQTSGQHTIFQQAEMKHFSDSYPYYILLRLLLLILFIIIFAYKSLSSKKISGYLYIYYYFNNDISGCSLYYDSIHHREIPQLYQ